MAVILQLRGLPASGKSTHAYDLIERYGTWKRINRDDLRAMVDHRVFSPSKEKWIRKAELLVAEMFLSSGLNTVVDDCNLSPSSQKMWDDLATRLQVQMHVKSFIDVPLEECLRRNKYRDHRVDEAVIREMHRKYILPLTPAGAVPLVVYNSNNPHAVVFELDGTLAHHTDRSPYDTGKCGQDVPNWKLVELLTFYKKSECKTILLVSGRREKFRAETIAWLKTHGILWDGLFMRADDDDRKDYIVKEEILKRDILFGFNVYLVYDDRSQCIDMWRANGLTCYQVAAGDF